VGIFDFTHIIGKFAEEADLNPGLESSKTIELLILIPLNLIAFKNGIGLGFRNSTSSLVIKNSNIFLSLKSLLTNSST
tara:strand:+ start:459 stop:692 length:234 start_codon:yes stop_codon:yes gene_type:complete